MTKEQENCENDYQEILAEGNTVAKIWSKRILGNKKYGKFLRILDNPASARSLKVEKEKVQQILEIPEEDKELIRESHALTEFMVRQFKKLAYSISHRYAVGIEKDNSADLSQLESEAIVGLLKAIRGYSDPEIKFITYATWVIRRELSRYMQRGMGGTLSGVDYTLFVKYHKAREYLLKKGEPHTVDDVCEFLQREVLEEEFDFARIKSEKKHVPLTNRQVKRLRIAICSQVSHESDIEEVLAKSLADKSKVPVISKEMGEKLDKALEKLTKFEKMCWVNQNKTIRSIMPKKWCRDTLKDVAKEFQKTPQAASEAAKRANKKIAASMGRDWKF